MLRVVYIVQNLFYGDFEMKKLAALLLTLTLAAATASAATDVTTPGDPVIGQANNGDWPSGENPTMAIDNDTATKYLHGGASAGCGIIISPQKGTGMDQTSIVTEITLTTANDSAGRDPWTYELYGSEFYTTGTWELISAGDLVDFNTNEWPRLTKNATPIVFENKTAYRHYKLMFPENGGESAFQIAEIELLGDEVSTPYLNTPSPAPGANIEEDAVTLSWVKPEDPNTVNMSYNVYFGSDPNAATLVKSAITDSADCFYDVTGLASGITYYWRVDGVQGGSVFAGPAWHFNTVTYIPVITEVTGAGEYRDEEVNIDLTASYSSDTYPVSGVVWYFNGAAIDPETNPDYSMVYADTESILTIADISAAVEGDYYCIVTNTYGDSVPSPVATVTMRTPWVWEGATGNWSSSSYWDKGTAPTTSDDVTIPSGVVTWSASSNLFYGGRITLEGDGQLIVPEGLRFGGGSNAETLTTIADDAVLTTGPANYFILSLNTDSVYSQTGGTLNASVDRGFFFSDNSAGSGTYNLTGGTMNVEFVDPLDGGSRVDWWSNVLGRGSNADYFNIDGGDAVFTVNTSVARDFDIMKDSVVTIDSGSLILNGFDYLYIGHSYDGNSKVIVNGGELDVNNQVVIGDSGKGTLSINGGTVNFNAGEGTTGLSSGSGRGTLAQAGGVADFNATNIVLGGSSDADKVASYTISGGDAVNIGVLTLKSNSEFGVSGSGAGQIDIDAIDVASESSAVIAADLDANGCSVITVSGVADLAGLTLAIDTLDSFVVVEGAPSNILWASDIQGEESITILNESNQLFEYRVVDATEYGYEGGELLQVVANYNPETADLNSDGQINFDDFAIFAQFWLWSADQE